LKHRRPPKATAQRSWPSAELQQEAQRVAAASWSAAVPAAFFGKFLVSSFQFFKIRFSVLGFLYPQMSEIHADSVCLILICVNLRHLRIPSPKPCLSCSSMFPFLQYPIRHRKAAGTAALQDAPATKQTPLAGRGR